jgi:hypothetical protein
MLVLACVALAVAIFFPVFEYVTKFRGEPAPQQMARPVAPPRTRAEPAPPPAGPEAPAAAEEAPAPVEEEAAPPAGEEGGP